MAGKISEMSDASALDGSEQLEVVQGGTNKKVTVNDLLPVQLQGDKTIDLNDHSLHVTYDGQDMLGIVIDEVGQSTNSLFQSWWDDGLGGNYGSVGFEAALTEANFLLDVHSNASGKVANILGNAGATSSSISYTADNHIFPDVVGKDFADDAAAAVGLVPVGGLYHTSGTLKIRLA